MQFKEEYQKKLITIEAALELVKSDDEICVGLAGSEPINFLSRLHEVKDQVENVNVLTCLNMGNYKFTSEPDMQGHFMNSSWFYSNINRKSHELKTTSFLPNHLHLSSRQRLSYKKPNIYVGMATPMDQHGFFSLSLSVTYEREYIEAADIVILEVSENFPRTYGDTFVHINEVDYFYVTDRKPPELQIIEPNSKDMIIGGYIAELIEDGSTIQLGIGGIPNAVAKSLMRKRDLGLHTEMITDGVVDLYHAGVLTNSKKTLHKGKCIGAFALGTQKLYDFIDNNPGVELLRGSYTNDPHVIGKNNKMISINTSLQVDLTGQCCSEALGHTQYSGTGGQTDTATGAKNSIGGKSFIALYSTAKNNTISTIVPELSPGATVSLSRNDVDFVVTEYGIATLTGRTLRERVDNLIGIAHPDFRKSLKEEANKYRIW
jgi:acyl-CoA hydrolase